MSRKFIIIQGIGCTETGARIVLRELLKAAPTENSYLVICTDETAIDFIGRRFGRFGESVYLCGLSHRIFGRWLRLPLELAIALGGLVAANLVICLSHYGLCLSRRYILYIHSPLLMDKSMRSGMGEGRPNVFKLAMLNSCIRRARLIVVQTQAVAEQLAVYCRAKEMKIPDHKIVRPKISVPPKPESKQVFSWQLFYPTSRFAHKRPQLAIDGARLAFARDTAIGLVITTSPNSSTNAHDKGVMQVGRINQEDTFAWFSGSQAMLFTSERETLGLPLLESLEYGLPVIAPRLPYAVELLGDAGCYFDNPSPEAVAEAIQNCRANYDMWRSKIRSRAAVVRRDAATWSEHWSIFFENRSK